MDGVHGANGHHAQGPAEEVSEQKNAIVTIQSKFFSVVIAVIDNLTLKAVILGRKDEGKVNQGKKLCDVFQAKFGTS